MPVRQLGTHLTGTEQELIDALVAEWLSPHEGDPNAPVILLESDPFRPQQLPQHIYVVWDRLQALNQSDRTRIILYAYQKAAGDAAVRTVTVAMGLTKDEADHLQIPHDIEGAA